MMEGMIRFCCSMLMAILAVGFIFQTTAYGLTLPDPAPETSSADSNQFEIQKFVDCLNTFTELDSDDIEFCSSEGEANVSALLEGVDYDRFAVCLSEFLVGHDEESPKQIDTDDDIKFCKSEASAQYKEETVDLPPPAYRVEFTGDISLIRKQSGAQRFDFEVKGLTEAQIGNVTGWIIKEGGQTFQKNVSKTSGTKYTFTWDTGGTAVGIYTIRIVVRGPAGSASAATGGPMLLYDDSQVLVVEKNQQFPKTITNQAPYIDATKGAAKLVFEGAVSGGETASGSSATTNDKITIYYIITTTENGAVKDQSLKATGDVVNGKYKIEVNPPNGMMASSDKKNIAYAADGFLANVVETTLAITNPAGYLGWKAREIWNKITKKTSLTGTPVGGGVGGPNASTDTATGLSSLMATLKGLVNPLGGGDPNQEITLRILAILNLLIEFASAILAMAAVWTGLLYIFSMGNDEQTAKAKKNMILIITGLIILLSALGIITLVRNLLESAKLGG